MSYEIGDGHDGGYEYRVTVNGLTMTGWRRGLRADIEKYLREVDRNCTLRAGGTVVTRNADGSQRKSHLRGQMRFRRMNGGT